VVTKLYSKVPIYGL